MRIAHVTATFPPYKGGTGTVCYYNAVGIAKLGHDVTVITTDFASMTPNDPPEITVRRLPALLRIGNAPLLPDLMRVRDFDLIHLHFPFVFGAEMLLLKRWLDGTRYVITYHQDLLYTGAMGTFAEVHHRFVGRLVLRNARRLMVTSLDYGKSARIAPQFHAMGNRVVEMPNGVDPARFHPGVDGSAIRSRYGLSAENIVILFVGGLDRAHYFKGVDVLLKAFSQTFSQLDDSRLRLMLVGDGDLRPSYEATAAQLGLSDRVIFCGRVGESELPAHYAACDLSVLPSTTMGEAFGVVLLEAMATAKPVIASSLPGVRSVVDDGENGFLARINDPADLAEKIERLAADPALRAAMGAKGRAKVEAKYAWEQIIKKLEITYRAVVNET